MDEQQFEQKANAFSGRLAQWRQTGVEVYANQDVPINEAIKHLGRGCLILAEGAGLTLRSLPLLATSRSKGE